MILRRAALLMARPTLADDWRTSEHPPVQPALRNRFFDSLVCPDFVYPSRPDRRSRAGDAYSGWTTSPGLRYDAAFKLAPGRLPRQGPLLAAVRPALGECADAAGNHPPHLRTHRDLVQKLPEASQVAVLDVLDIDDTIGVLHGHQQLAQWNAHYDERCFRVPVPGIGNASSQS